MNMNHVHVGGLDAQDESVPPSRYDEISQKLTDLKDQSAAISAKLRDNRPSGYLPHDMAARAEALTRSVELLSKIPGATQSQGLASKASANRTGDVLAMAKFIAGTEEGN